MTASAPGSSERGGPLRPTDTAPGKGRGSREAMSEYFSVTDRRRAGRRYGRFVGVAKLLLLTAAAGLIALLAIWPQFGKDSRIFQIGKVKIETEDVESLRVVNARFTGTSAEGHPYSLTFDTASQSRAEADLVVLTAPKADIVLKDGAWVALTSPAGRFRREARILELDSPVDMVHDSGIEIRTGSVNFNLETGTGAGLDPLVGQAPFGEIKAAGFRIRENTAVFRFVGPVRAVLFGAPELAR